MKKHFALFLLGGTVAACICAAVVSSSSLVVERGFKSQLSAAVNPATIKVAQ